MGEMERAEQYEIWTAKDDDRWEFAASFARLDVASAMAQSHGRRRVRLLHTVYENGKRVMEEVLAEIGAVRGG